MTEVDEYLTPEAAAAKLGVAHSTLVRWRRETRKRGEQVGPVWVNVSTITIRYRSSAIAEFMNSREQRADG